ncbi:hypothetical protein MRX96_036098 [Rhipicephalus microplus]
MMQADVQQQDNGRKRATVVDSLKATRSTLTKHATTFTLWLHAPCDPASLAMARILFGAVMVLDQPEERGLAFIEERWGDPKECRFPLFSFLKPLSLEGMYCVHLIMLLGAAGICTGAFFKQSCLAFLLPYWFIFLLEKSRHQYSKFVFPAAERATSTALTWHRGSRLEELPKAHNFGCGERYRRGFRDRITTEMSFMVPEASRRRWSKAGDFYSPRLRREESGAHECSATLASYCSPVQ